MLKRLLVALSPFGVAMAVASVPSPRTKCSVSTLSTTPLPFRSPLRMVTWVRQSRSLRAVSVPANPPYTATRFLRSYRRLRLVSVVGL